jgi:lipoyl(octanoyl) transferase
MAEASPQFAVEDLGRMTYAAALAVQRERHEAMVAARAVAPPHRILLVEHDPPVVTVTRRPGARDHVLAAPEALAAAGVELHETDRGGDVTWHGPGQLVAYPIVDLQRLGLGIHAYIRAVEDAIIGTCAVWGIPAHREEGATGVWTGEPGPGARKVAAIGVRVSRWVTMHGLALNVAPDLRQFGLIVPCGLHGRAVTSVADELGRRGAEGRVPGMDEAKAVLAARLAAALTRP